jgi:large subunit ribosomal protein L10
VEHLVQKARKEGIVQEVKEKLSKSQVVILTDYRGLNVAEITDLRRQLREEGIEFKVVKNTLTKIAAGELGYESLKDHLEGPTAVAFGYQDPVTAAKILAKFAKGNEKLEIKAGMLAGGVIDLEAIRALADLPSREVLLGRVLGAFQSPLTAFAGVLQGNIRNLIQVLNAIREEKEKSA